MKGIKAKEIGFDPGSIHVPKADPTDLFFHALAILPAPAYRAENAVHSGVPPERNSEVCKPHLAQGLSTTSLRQDFRGSQ
jgi:hypothetical protein